MLPPDDASRAIQLEDSASRAVSEIRFEGHALAPGVGLGQACFYRTGKLAHNDVGQSQTNEAQRLRGALVAVTEQLRNLARDAQTRLGREAGDIFRAQSMMLDDAGLQRALMSVLDDAAESAESAVHVSLGRYQDELQAADSPYLRERAGDIAELKQRLMEQLAKAAPYVHAVTILTAGWVSAASAEIIF